MNNENIVFYLFVGIALIVAGYFVEELYAVLGVLVCVAGILVIIVMKLQEKNREE